MPTLGLGLIENGVLQEVHVERETKRGLVGNVYLGKVIRVLPGMQAAFVDIGYERDAFLHYLELGPQFRTLNKYVKSSITRKGKVMTIIRRVW